MGIVQCLFNLLYYVIGVRNTKIPPKKGLKSSFNYRKILKISPGAYIFQRPFLRGLFSEGLRGLSTEENLRFKIDWASLIKFEVSLPFLLCFTLYAPAGLIFGGAI